MNKNPPFVDKMYVQKKGLSQADLDKLILRVKYLPGQSIPQYLPVYWGASSTATLRNDGQGGDSTANDLIWSVTLNASFSQFRSNVIQLNRNLVQKGSFLTFEGHTGILNTRIPGFDSVGFDLGRQVELEAKTTEGISTCTDVTLKKQNSLFITDLSVVEDPARTYNYITGTGNMNGIYTFSNMIKNVVNSTATNATKSFLLSWLQTWTSSHTINGIVVPDRPGIIEALITPWIVKASEGTIAQFDITRANWITKWNSITEAKLLQYAPFKLTAIVNRIDLRGNTAYAPSLTNSGETRFIFSAVLDGPTVSGISGVLPQNFDQGAVEETA